MARRVNPTTDELFVKGIDELDPATSLSDTDKIIVFQGTATRAASMGDVFGVFASTAELDDLRADVTASLSNLATLTTDQTIGGTKTFTTIPVLPESDPTLANQAVRKAYVDGLLGDRVTLTGDQSVGGIKTFSSNPITTATQSTNNGALTRRDFVMGLDAQNVKLTDTQSIGGTKTFTTIPVLPATDPTTVNQAVRKGYVDSLDAANVKLTGDQSIGGIKTFTSSPVIPAGTLATDAVNKSQLDTKVGLTGNETISGLKTFSSIPVLPASNPTLADEATRKAYVDALDASSVKTTGDQTIGGTKTFSAIPLTSATQSAVSNSLVRRDFVTGLDSANIKTSGDQTIGGIKTFSVSPVIPDATLPSHPVTKAQLDAVSSGGGGLTDGDQTINGVKTFSSMPLTSAVQPAASNSLVRRDFVTGLDAQNVKLTGSQTISGAKTFSGSNTFSALQTFTNDIRIDSDSTRSLAFRTAAGVDQFVIQRDAVNNRTVISTPSDRPVLFSGACPQVGSAPTTTNSVVTKGYVDGSLVDYATTFTDQTIGGVKTFSSIPLLPATNPTSSNQAVRKGYVDGLIGGQVTLAGDQTITGFKQFDAVPNINADPVSPLAATRKSYVDGLDSANVKLTGNQTVAGVKTFSSNPISSAAQSTAVNALTRKDYVDGVAAPIGSILMWASGTAPTNWLFCQGQAISRTTYAALFAILGTTYGAGDGTTTFNLPDLRGRMALGAGISAASGASRALGTTGGADTHTLTVDEMPSHDHGGVTGNRTITIDVRQSTATGGNNSQSVRGGAFDSNAASNHATSPAHNHSISADGGGQPHNNLPPFMALNFIIRAQ